MMTFGKIKSVHKQSTDSLGRFKFILKDEYGRNLNILIQSAGKFGENRDYTITLDKKVSPAVSFNHVKTIGKVDSVVQIIVEKNIERKQIEDTFRLSAGSILLGEVVVNGLRLTPQRKKVIEVYGPPDEIIDGKDIEAKEQKWSYGLYSVLMFNFPDSRIDICQACDGNLCARVKNPSPTLVVIDGKPVKPHEYDLIPNIPPGEVKGIDIIENARNFTRLYLDVFAMDDPSKLPSMGNVIAIYTYAGKGLFGAERPVGILKASVPVFSFPSEFYAPRYDNIQSTDRYKPDLRALVHWEPILKTDSAGQASATFYNADNTGEMLVVVEAISGFGEIGYQELVYHVKKNENLQIIDHESSDHTNQSRY
jgi:hypothetical protein